MDGPVLLRWSRSWSGFPSHFEKKKQFCHENIITEFGSFTTQRRRKRNLEISEFLELAQIGDEKDSFEVLLGGTGHWEQGLANGRIAEEHALCDAGEFLCRDGITCVSWHWLCDGEPDCPDDSDESLDTYVKDENYMGSNHGPVIAQKLDSPGTRSRIK
ncbi:hypothetical protein TURU_163690 [Turdus rufiventris]|nr:hypothetical protein TURU_163690 [Turdus rufiventris]